VRARSSITSPDGLSYCAGNPLRPPGATLPLTSVCTGVNKIRSGPASLRRRVRRRVAMKCVAKRVACRAWPALLAIAIIGMWPRGRWPALYCSSLSMPVRSYTGLDRCRAAVRDRDSNRAGVNGCDDGRWLVSCFVIISYAPTPSKAYVLGNAELRIQQFEGRAGRSETCPIFG